MNSKVKEKAVRRAKKATERALSLQRRREELEAKKALIWFELLSKSNGTSLLSGSEETVKKVRELCRQGIPPNVRGRVWPLLIGNEEEIGAERFNALKKQADEVRKSSGLMGFGDGAERKDQPSSSGATQVLNVEKGHGLELRKDSLDIGMERLSLGALDIPVNEGSDTNESILGSSSSSSPLSDPSPGEAIAQTLVDAQSSSNPRRMSEMEGTVFQNSASSIDDRMRSGSLDLRGSFDLSKAFPFDKPTPPRPSKKDEKAAAPTRDDEHDGDDPEDIDDGDDEATGDNGENKSLSTKLIKYDLPRTLPTLKFFHDGGSLNEDLERVLCAYTILSPEVGYVQGMSFVVAMLLLYLDDAETLSCFVNLMKRKGIGEFYLLRREALDAYVQCFDYFFEQSLPLLFGHLRKEGVMSDMFLLDWHLTLFVKPLPLDAAARVWDCFLAGDEMFGLRIALGILRLYAPVLSGMNLEQLMTFLTRLPEDLNADVLLDSVHEIKISYKKFKKVREKAELQAGIGGSPMSKGGKEKDSQTQCSVM